MNRIMITGYSGTVPMSTSSHLKVQRLDEHDRTEKPGGAKDAIIEFLRGSPGLNLVKDRGNESTRWDSFLSIDNLHSMLECKDPVKGGETEQYDAPLYNYGMDIACSSDVLLPNLYSWFTKASPANTVYWL